MSLANSGSDDLLKDLSDRLGDFQIARWIIEEARSSVAEQNVNSKACEIADRYLRGEPLQYLFGHWSFRRLEVYCDNRALIPRPETELLVDLVQSALKNRKLETRILEIGTGTGAIALSLGTENPGLSIVATDLSQAALELARKNLAKYQKDLLSPVTLVHSDLFERLNSTVVYDFIVSNPPYVPASSELCPTVFDHEPHVALFAGEDGLDVIRKLIAEAPEWLLGEGSEVFIEIDHTQGPAVIDLGAKAGFREATIHNDLSGRVRFAHLIL